MEYVYLFLVLTGALSVGLTLYDLAAELLLVWLPGRREPPPARDAELIRQLEAARIAGVADDDLETETPEEKRNREEMKDRGFFS